MPLPAPRPLDALRQYTRAVILTADGCQLSDDLGALAARSGVRCEFVDHPLLAVAALTTIEREAKPPERAALIVAERQIDDLDGLFSTVRSRLQRIAIWVFEADIAIEVQRGQGVETPEPAPRERAVRAVGSTAPALRISRPPEPPAAWRTAAPSVEAELDRAPEGASEGAFEHPSAGPSAGASDDAPEDPPGPSGNSVTAEELEMLLNLFERDLPPRHDDGGAR